MAASGPRLPSPKLGRRSADDSGISRRPEGWDERLSNWASRRGFREFLLKEDRPSSGSGPMLRRHSEPHQLGSDVLHKCFEHRDLPRMDDGELKRGLGPVELTLLGVGACIGAGIFVLTGVEARAAGPSVGLAFCVAAASSVFNGLCYAELSSRLPISGSAYLYAYCMFGELPAMVVVVNQLLDYHIGAATISRSLMAYIGNSIEAAGVPLHPCVIRCQPFESVPWLSISIGAPAVLFVLTFVVAGGAKMSAGVTSFMSAVKLAIVVFVITVGVRLVDVDLWQPFFPYGMGATLQAAATLNYAFIGYDVIANAAEEAKNPQRDIPVSIVTSLAICAVLYLVVCMVLCGMQSYSEIDAAAPMASAFVQRDMVWVASTINIGAFFGMTTGLLAGLYGQSRIYFALARDELAPNSLKRPALSAAWCGCIAALLAAFIDVHQLASMLNIGVLLAYGSTAASVLKINNKERCEELRTGAFFGSENFYLLTVVVLTVALSHGASVSPLLPWLAFAGLVFVMCWVCLFRTYDGCAGGAFKCPGVPVTPMIALATDTYLATKLSANAWLRLGATSVVVTLVVGVVTFIDLERRPGRICETVRAAAKAAGTKPGLCNQCG